MFKCKKLKTSNFNCFKYLNKQRLEFNNKNEDFFHIYEKVNIFKKIMMMRKVVLIQDEETLDYIGYIWVSKLNKHISKIRSFSVLDNYKYNIECYLNLVDTIYKNSSITYLCEKNEYNYIILQKLGFQMYEGILQMKRYIDTPMYIIAPKYISIQKFQSNKDEVLRCLIQNSIFEDKNRIPLTLDDINFEKNQEYFYEDGCFFLKFKDIIIGYGQIIFEEQIPYIVNFGIVPKYRGKGYAKYFLSYLLNYLYNNNFTEVKIKVMLQNQKALRLYKSMNFKLEKELYKWKLIK